MVVDYFTKWVEVEALANIRNVNVKKFVWRNIVIRFGVLESLVYDNGLKFDSKTFRKFYSDLGIKTGTQPRHIHKAMVMPKQLIKQLLVD